MGTRESDTDRDLKIEATPLPGRETRYRILVSAGNAGGHELIAGLRYILDEIRREGYDLTTLRYLGSTDFKTVSFNAQKSVPEDWTPKDNTICRG